MAKKKQSDTVKIKRGAQEKTISQAQWKAMKETKSTYGWMPASEVPDDVKTKEQQIELSQVQDLQKQLKDSEAANADFKKAVQEKDATIEEQTATIEEQKATIDELTKKLEVEVTGTDKDSKDSKEAKTTKK